MIKFYNFKNLIIEKLFENSKFKIENFFL